MFPRHEMRGDSLDLLDPGSFIHFFLTPVTATCLIAEDLSITTKDAYSVMLNSRQVGHDAFSCKEGEDEECDEILYAAMKAIKRPKPRVEAPLVVDSQVSISSLQVSAYR